MLIYKILSDDEWAMLERAGQIEGAPIDVADGYVHFSTGSQVAETAAKHFAGRSDLWLLALEADALGDALAWEPSRGGDLFPHLYGPLRRADVVWAAPLALYSDGRHRFPDGVE